MIAGGSYAGLAIASGLSQALGGDVRIAILERGVGGSAAADSRAFAVWAGAKRALEGLGVWEELESVASPITGIEISDSALDDGVRPARLNYDGITSAGDPAAFMVPAARLEAALRDRVRADPAITWIAPVTATGLASEPHAITVALGNSALGGGRSIDAQLVVAADGRNSRLREAAGIKTIGWPYEQTGIVATVQFSEPHGGLAIQHFLPGGPFAILPLQGNRACITWSAARSEADAVLALDDAAFLAELDRRIGGRFGTIALSGPRQSWPLDVKLPRSLIAPRFALAGDAAHGVHPVAGQGVNLALRDAAALIECVADAVRLGFDFGHAPALERYQRWRRFDSAMSASMYDGLNRVFSVDNTVVRAGRSAGLALLDRLPAAKRWIVDEAAGVNGDLPKLMRGEAV